MNLQVDFGAAQTGIGYRFYGANGAFVGSRITTNIHAAPQVGVYVVNATIPVGATGVYWDSANPLFYASEELSTAISLISGVFGSGAYAVTVTVTDGASPLQNATVRLTEGISSVTSVTNSSGVASFSLDAATYIVGISKSGYVFVPGTIVVAGNGNFNKAMTTTVIPPSPSDTALCRVYGYVEDVHGLASAGVKIVFTLTSARFTLSEKIIGGRVFAAVTDSQGRISDGTNPYVDLQRNDLLTPNGTKYRVASDVLNLDKNITLAAPTFDIGSLI